MKRTLEGSPAPANTLKVRHDEPASGAGAPTAADTSGAPTVYNRNADLIEELKRQTNAQTVKNGNFMKEEFKGTSITQTPASGQLLIPYSPYQSPIVVQPLTPQNALPEVFVLHSAAGKPQIVTVGANLKRFLFELPTDILLSIIRLLDRHALYRLDASCKKLNELAASIVPGSMPYSATFKVRPCFRKALPGEFNLDDVSTYPKTCALFERGLDRTQIFCKVGLRNDSIFTSAKEVQRNQLQFIQDGNQIRQLRVKLGSAERFNKFVNSCNKANFGNDCSMELIFNPKRIYGADDKISLDASSMPVRSLVLDRLNQIAVFKRETNQSFSQIKRLALGHDFHMSRGLTQGHLKQLFPEVEELALTSTRSLPFYLDDFPDITALSISVRWNTSAQSEFDTGKILATKLETLCLDSLNLEDGNLIGIANETAKRSLQSLYLIDCYETPLEDLKELIRQLPRLKNLVLADFHGLSEEEIEELIAWAATERPTLKLQAYR